MFRSLLVLGFVSLAAAHGSQAQQDTTGLVPGQWVRIHQGKHAVIGTLLFVDSAVMWVLTTQTDTAFLRRADITGVDVSTGRKSKTLSGALIGAGVGAVGLGLAAYLSGAGGDGSVAVIAMAIPTGFVLGAGIGAAIGSGSHTYRWEPAIWPTLTFSLGGPAGRSIALGGHLRF